MVHLNQPRVLDDVTRLFAQSPLGGRYEIAPSYHTPRDRHAVRTLTASEALATYLAELGWRASGRSRCCG